MIGGARRAIDFHEVDKIDEKALKALIRAAVAMNTSVRAKQASLLPGERMCAGTSEVRGVSGRREFGDGIISAIDFAMAMECLPIEGAPCEDPDVEQVPAVQILRRGRQWAGIRV